MRVALLYLTGFLTAVGTAVAPAQTTLSDAPVAFTARAITDKSPAGSDLLTIPRSGDGLFYVDGNSGSGSIRFLVDTGATHVIMSHADAASVSTRKLADSVDSIRTAAGTVKVRWVVIERLRVAGHELRDVKAAIPERDVGISLLGQNALAQFTQLRIDGDKLVLLR